MAYWYNVETQQVETDENRSQNADVMGPYDTREEASNALAIAARKTADWDEEDREWEERGSEE